MTKQKKIRDEILDELLSSYEEPEDLLGRDGVIDQLRKALIERALGAELYVSQTSFQF